MKYIANLLTLQEKVHQRLCLIMKKDSHVRVEEWIRLEFVSRAVHPEELKVVMEVFKCFQERKGRANHGLGKLCQNLQVSLEFLSPSLSGRKMFLYFFSLVHFFRALGSSACSREFPFPDFPGFLGKSFFPFPGKKLSDFPGNREKYFT